MGEKRGDQGSQKNPPLVREGKGKCLLEIPPAGQGGPGGGKRHSSTTRPFQGKKQDRCSVWGSRREET